jgi:hypothetical protein
MIWWALLIAVAGVATCLAGCCYIGIVLMVAIIGRAHQALHVDARILPNLLRRIRIDLA